MHRGSGAALICSLVVVALVTGCGSDGNNGSTQATEVAATGMTKSKFIERGNAICKRGSDEIHVGLEALKKKLGIGSKGSLSKVQEEELVEEVVVPSVQKQAESLAQLPPPPGDKNEVNEIVAGLGRVAQAGRESPTSIMVAAGPIEAVNLAAKKYGVAECTQP